MKQWPHSLSHHQNKCDAARAYGNVQTRAVIKVKGGLKNLSVCLLDTLVGLAGFV